MAEKIKNIRLLALDIDGTLMNSKKEFPEINRRALQQCERQGVKAALISGRSFELMRKFAQQLGIHPIMAACNGSRIEAGENGPTLAEHCFTREQAERICRTMEESGMYFNSYRRGKCYLGNSHVRPSLGPRYAHHVPGVCGDPGYLYETLDDRARLWGEGMDGVYKFVVLGMPYDPGFDKIAAQLSDMQLSVSKASKRNMEFMPPGVDKGFAVRGICREMGISADQVMAFGDQTNDIPMLQAAGWPVAMENGEDSVKAAARLIAPDHDLGGVGLMLQRYILEEEISGEK